MSEFNLAKDQKQSSAWYTVCRFREPQDSPEIIRRFWTVR